MPTPTSPSRSASRPSSAPSAGSRTSGSRWSDFRSGAPERREFQRALEADRGVSVADAPNERYRAGQCVDSRPALEDETSTRIDGYRDRGTPGPVGFEREGVPTD